MTSKSLTCTDCEVEEDEKIIEIEEETELKKED
jgi:hypothetical protein